MHAPTVRNHHVARRSAVTLIEMLVAIIATLIMMGAVSKIFLVVGDETAMGRARLDLISQLRSARQRLQEDLEGLTARTLSSLDPAAGDGYFEYSEGTKADDESQWPTLRNDQKDARWGDPDDVLAFTTRSLTGPMAISGSGTGAVQSHLAEVIWFLHREEDSSDYYTLCRRVRLIEPVSGNSGRSLSSLTKRENRFQHGSGYPHAIDSALSPEPDEIVLTNVLSFDVKAWDPQAPIRESGSLVLVPGDPGYGGGAASGARGAFVNLGYATGGSSHFSGVGNVTGLQRTWDTWPLHYEYDGVQQGNGPVDQGTNGFDDDGANGVDDIGERETKPPYDRPLRGIEIKIRIYEPGTRQVREVTLTKHFLPE